MEAADHRTGRARKRVKTTKNDESVASQSFANLLSTGRGVYLGLLCSVSTHKYEFKLVDAKSFDVLAKMVLPAHCTYSMSFSLQCGKLTVVSRNNLKMWDVLTGREVLKEIDANFSSYCLSCVNNSGSKIAISAAHNDIVDVVTRSRIRLPMHQLAQSKHISAFRFNYDDENLLGCSGNFLYCWNANNGNIVRCTDVGTDCDIIPTVIASPDSPHCALTDDEIIVWNYLTGDVFQPHVEDFFTCIDACLGGNKLFVLKMDAVDVWDIVERQYKYEVKTIALAQIVYSCADDTLWGSKSAGRGKVTVACYRAGSGEPIEECTKESVDVGGDVDQLYATRPLTILL